MNTVAVVLEQPERVTLQELSLNPAGPADLLVNVSWSGISSGTERLLWSGRMPPFPGMGYPLVPGYETVGRVCQAGGDSGFHEGDLVFVPGANCYRDVRGLFGGSSSRIVTAATRAVHLPEEMAETGILFALAATAHHAIAAPHAGLPDLIIGHGILGRLIARIAIALGGAPIVWETNPLRRSGAEGYRVIDPSDDNTSGYATICDASGDAGLIDTLVRKLVRRGEIVLAGFYETPVAFTFPPAFMREARFRIAAEWSPEDMLAVKDLVTAGRLSLAGLITHHAAPQDAPDAYGTAFNDPACLKMVLDWRTIQ